MKMKQSFKNINLRQRQTKQFNSDLFFSVGVNQQTLWLKELKKTGGISQKLRRK